MWAVVASGVAGQNNRRGASFGIYLLINEILISTGPLSLPAAKDKNWSPVCCFDPLLQQQQPNLDRISIVGQMLSKGWLKAPYAVARSIPILLLLPPLLQQQQQLLPLLLLLLLLLRLQLLLLLLLLPLLLLLHSCPTGYCYSYCCCHCFCCCCCSY